MLLGLLLITDFNNENSKKIMTKKYAGKIYDSKEIRELLSKQLPNWTYSDGFLSRIFKTGGWRVSLMVANAVGHQSELAWHHPKLVVSYGEIEILLNTHEADGITDRDLALAEKIEEFVSWLPGENGDDRLPGLPENPNLTYITK